MKLKSNPSNLSGNLQVEEIELRCGSLVGIYLLCVNSLRNKDG